MREKVKEVFSSYAFLLPGLVLILVFVYISLGWNLFISFTGWDTLFPSYNFVGLSQYKKLITDPVFWISLKNNALLIALFVPSSLGIGLIFAVFLDQKIRLEKVFRTIYLLPFGLSFVVTGTLWAWMYNSKTGVVNTLLRSVGLDFLALDWITNPNIAIYSLIAALVWQFAGYCMLIYLAGIRTIPDTHYEAAKIDGASTFQIYSKVVIPQLKGPTLSAFVVVMIFSLKSFSFIKVITAGGPGYSTFTLAIQMYQQTFSHSNFAYGAAIANILLFMVILIVGPYLYVNYGGGES